MVYIFASENEKKKKTQELSLKQNLILIFSLLCLQDDHKAFRRQLEDKRPIVESNLTSGRQYIASETPVSDTSDTEGKFYG